MSGVVEKIAGLDPLGQLVSDPGTERTIGNTCFLVALVLDGVDGRE